VKGSGTNSRRWSAEVTRGSNALELENNVFKNGVALHTSLAGGWNSLANLYSQNAIDPKHIA